MTITEPEIPFAVERAPRAAEYSWPRRAGRGLKTFAKRSPLAAFWGSIAAAILVMAIAAPVFAPYDPLKSDFRAMSKPPPIWVEKELALL